MGAVRGQQQSGQDAARLEAAALRAAPAADGGDVDVQPHADHLLPAGMHPDGRLPLGRMWG